jgi:hypothetical protein
MDAALAGLLGASIGAISGVLGGLVAGRQQRKLESVRWKQARADEVRIEERRSLLELTKLLAEGYQAASWLSWAAEVKPIDAVKADANDYDTRMRTLLPRIASAEAAASGLSDEAFARIDPFVERLLILDTKLGAASVRLDDEPENALRELTLLQDEASQLYRQVVRGMRSQLRMERAVIIGEQSTL